MEITPIGWILIPLGVALALVRPKWLYYLTIFFAPFSATSVLNHGSGSAASGVMPYMLLAFLLFLRELANALTRFSIRFARSIRRFVYMLLLFLGVCGASLVMPLIINGKLEVMSGPSLNYALVPLQITRTQFTNLAGLIFGILLAALVAQYNVVPEQFYRSLRVYLISGVFISVWGLMQFGLSIAGIPYPFAVFNNSASSGALGYRATLQATHIQRISSVAMEPSYLAIVLAGMIPMLLIAILYKRPILGRLSDRVALLLIGVVLVLTMSSTGYLGMIVLMGLLPFCLSQYRQFRWKLVAGILLLLGGLVAAFVAIPVVRDALTVVLIDKAASVSALERLTVIFNDLNYFLKYPLLGIGWASAPTHDLVVGMLANCGLIGFSCFALSIFAIGSRLRRAFALETSIHEAIVPPLMMFLSLFITCLSYVISGPIGRGEFWIVLGLSISAVVVAGRRQAALEAA